MGCERRCWLLVESGGGVRLVMLRVEVSMRDVCTEQRLVTASTKGSAPAAWEHRGRATRN